MKILALIPARGGSKSIPKKNLAALSGKPLIQYTIDAAKASTYINKIVLSSDDEEIISYCRKQGVDIPFTRPVELSGDETPILPVIKHMIGELSKENYIPDFLVLLQPTSPLRSHVHIDEAIEFMIKSDADTLVSVTSVPHQFNPVSLLYEHGGKLFSFLPEGKNILRRQDKPLLYARNGPAIVIFRVKELMNRNSLYGNELVAFKMNKENSIDIDDYFDLQTAEYFLKKRN